MRYENVVIPPRPNLKGYKQNICIVTPTEFQVVVSPCQHKGTLSRLRPVLMYNLNTSLSKKRFLER